MAPFLIGGAAVVLFLMMRRGGAATVPGSSGLTPQQGAALNANAAQLAATPATGLNSSGGSQLVNMETNSASNIGVQTLLKGIAGSGAAAGGGVAVGAALSTAAETAGIAAAAILAAYGIGNLMTGGTITRIGCTKVADSNTAEELWGTARLVGYQYLLGHLTLAQALAALQQMDAEAKSGFQRASDYTQAPPGNPPNWLSGDFSTYSAGARSALHYPPNIPDTSPAAWWYVGPNGNMSIQHMLEVAMPYAFRNPTDPALFHGGSIAAAKSFYHPPGGY